MKEITIRTARLEDLSTLLEFEQGIIAFERPFDNSLADDPISYYDIEAYITSPDAEVVVAVADDEIVGSAYAKIKEGDPYLKEKYHAYLGFMFTKPDYRGRGINKQIIEVLKAWTIRKNLSEMRLQVYADNPSAIRAYEKADFKKHTIIMRYEL